MKPACNRIPHSRKIRISCTLKKIPEPYTPEKKRKLGPGLIWEERLI